MSGGSDGLQKRARSIVEIEHQDVGDLVTICMKDQESSNFHLRPMSRHLERRVSCNFSNTSRHRDGSILHPGLKATRTPSEVVRTRTSLFCPESSHHNPWRSFLLAFWKLNFADHLLLGFAAA